MTYQNGLKKTKEYLKTHSLPDIIEVCNTAGLTDKEREMVILRYRQGKQRFHASEKLGISESRFSVKITNILNIIKSILIKGGFIDE